MSYSPFSPFGPTNSFINSRIASDMSSGRYRGSASRPIFLDLFDKLIILLLFFLPTGLGFLITLISNLAYSTYCVALFVTALVVFKKRLENPFFNDSEIKNIKNSFIRIIIWGSINALSAIPLYLFQDVFPISYSMIAFFSLITLLVSQTLMIFYWFDSTTVASATSRREYKKREEMREQLSKQLDLLTDLKNKGLLSKEVYETRRDEILERLYPKKT